MEDNLNRTTLTTARLKSGTSLLALSLALQGFAAVAAHAADEQQAQAPAVEEVVVTGSRLVASGFETPTPVTVISAQTLVQSMPSNIADALKQVPALGATLSANQTGSGTGA